ncbi:MAG: ATP-binding protein [Anaerolineae bacterium]
MIDIQRLIRQRDYLLDITRALTSQLDLNEVLKRILRLAAEMLGGQAGLIALIEEEGFRLRASVGIPSAVASHFRLLLTDIPRGDAASFRIPELEQKLRLVAEQTGIEFRQVVALPMTFGGEMVGVVYIFREYGTGFTPNEVRLLQSFADHAAIAVQNARLYEKALTEQQRLDAILRHSADGIMILRNNLTVESLNLALARMTGISVEEAPGLHHDDVIRWAKREAGMDLKEAVAGGWPLTAHSVLYVEGDLLHTSGSTLSIGITYAPLFDHTGQFRNIIANVRDITRFREAEEAKDTFISVISHELKTPVSLIKGYASTLSRSDVEWDRRVVLNGLQVIEEEADKLAALIDNLLDATRVQLGTLTLRLSSVALDRLAEKLVESFRTQTDRHTIRAEFPPDFPVVEADEQRIGQVLSNLLSNAIKYSPDGGEIVVSGTVGESTVEIAVSDQGIGLTPEQQSLIFDRFYRVENTLTRATQGAGLGLYIVRSLVEAHGGQIWVESEPGVGTTFRFTLPLSRGPDA